MSFDDSPEDGANNSMDIPQKIVDITYWNPQPVDTGKALNAALSEQSTTEIKYFTEPSAASDCGNHNNFGVAKAETGKVDEMKVDESKNTLVGANVAPQPSVAILCRDPDRLYFVNHQQKKKTKLNVEA
jgi:hypothetical protein